MPVQYAVKVERQRGQANVKACGGRHRERRLLNAAEMEGTSTMHIGKGADDVAGRGERLQAAAAGRSRPRRAGQWALALCLGLALAGGSAWAEGPAGMSWLQAPSIFGAPAGQPATRPDRQPAAGKPDEAKETKEPEAPERGEKAIPLTFSLEYTLVSDYIWRGVNLSEYRGEGREKLNHQLNVGVAWDTGRFGTLQASVWFEWYAGQMSLDPASDGHLQEVDYTLCWSYDIEPLGTTVELGWIAYHLPQVYGDAQTSYDVCAKLSFNDGKLCGKDEGVLNPYVALYRDVDQVKGTWLEFGISHDFALADMGFKETPILKDLTISPSLTLGVDHRYFMLSTQLANLTYGLAVSYDLGGSLGIPAGWGSLTLKGFLNYSQALTLKRDLDGYQDEFWGGMTLGYQW